MESLGGSGLRWYFPPLGLYRHYAEGSEAQDTSTNVTPRCSSLSGEQQTRSGLKIENSRTEQQLGRF